MNRKHILQKEDVMKKFVCCFDDEPNDLYQQYIIISPNYTNVIRWMQLKGKKYTVLEDCWNHESDVQTDKQYIERIKGKLVVFLTKELNDYHKTSFSSKEWRIALDAWVYMYLSSLYEKYRRLETLAREPGEFESERYANRLFPIDYSEYKKWIYDSDAFNKQMYYDLQKIIPWLNINYKTTKETKTKHVPLYKKNLGYYKFNCYRILLRIILATNNRKINVILNDSYLPHSFLTNLMRSSHCKVVNFQEDYLRHEACWVDEKIDEKWRNESREYASDDMFERTAFYLVRKYLPVVYVEGFSKISNMQDKWFGELPNLRAAIYTCYGLTYDELFKNFLLHKKHKNKKLKLIDIQHGGNYGVDRNQLMETEYDCSDVMFTWGREYSAGGCKTIAMPAAKLLDTQINNRGDGTILYVSYSFGKDYTMIENNQVFYRSSIEKEVDFLKTLSKPIRDKMVIRLYETQSRWGLKERIKEEIPDAKFDEVCDYYESLMRASFVVCSAWNTTCIEALYAGVPFVVLKNIDEIEEEAKKDAYEMKENGLLAENWDELKKIVNMMSTNEAISEWWEAEDRAQFVRKLKEKYAYMPDDALNIWNEKINSFCDKTNV